MKEIAENHGVSENAVLIQWQIQRGVVPITTTGKKERVGEYLRGVEVRLDVEEVERISRVGLGYHVRASQVQRFDPEDRS